MIRKFLAPLSAQVWIWECEQPGRNGQTALGALSLLALERQSAVFNPVWARRPLCLPTVDLSPVHFVLRYMCQINCACAVDLFFMCLWHIEQLFFGALVLGGMEWWLLFHVVISENNECAYVHWSNYYLLPNHKKLLEICYKMWFCPSIFHMAFNFHCLFIYNSRCLFNHHVKVCSMKFEWSTKCRDQIIGIIS